MSHMDNEDIRVCPGAHVSRPQILAQTFASDVHQLVDNQIQALSKRPIRCRLIHPRVQVWVECA